MKRTLLMIALGLACALTSVYAKKPKVAPVPQQIAPDTLGDLKAEMDYQEQQLMPFLALHNAAQAEFEKCVLSVFKMTDVEVLAHPGCGREQREVRRVSNMANPTAIKYTEAKEAYEREQRKADRTK